MVIRLKQARNVSKKNKQDVTKRHRGVHKNRLRPMGNKFNKEVRSASLEFNHTTS